MLIACKCLNISIQLGKTKPKGIHLSSLNLSDQEKSAAFFSEGVAEVDDVVSIKKQMPALVVSQNVGNWIIDSCINCSLTYFAQHKDKSKPPLISAGLISDPNTILKLKNHPDFSFVFRIVIAPQNEGKFASLITDKPANIVNKTLTELQQQVSDAVQQQAAKTDENIRIYSEQQYELLETFRDRASRDHKALVRLIYNLTATADEPSNTSMMSESDISLPSPTSPSKAIPTSALSTLMNSTPLPKSRPISAAVNTPARYSAGRSHSLFSPCRNIAESFDAEGVFNLDGMEESPPELGASEGESDTDHDDSGSHDEGIDLRRINNNAMQLARSLPVSVPVHGPNGPKTIAPDFDDDPLEPQEPQDIAASIKALARSVHGDAIFGDLPRPRFSTQI